MPAIKIFQPSDVLHPGEPEQIDFASFTHRFLAQGDSWFSFGSALPTKTSNMLNPLKLKDSACVVNCAVPGAELVRMVDSRRDERFVTLLDGFVKIHWDGILLSGGGNDLIDAIRTPSVDEHGAPVEPRLRLLLTPAERGQVAAIDGYVSEDGWKTFETHLVAQFQAFIALRDDPASQSAGVPVFVHTYDFLTPRDAGAGLGHGPWLSPALQDYRIPTADWNALSRHFLERLRDLMNNLRLPALHVAQTQGTLTPAAMGSSGESNDWKNEIHPDRAGYKKIAKVYGALIDATMP